MRIVIPNVSEYLSYQISVRLVNAGFEVIGVGDQRTIGEELRSKGVQFCFADSKTLSTVYSSLLRPHDVLIHAAAPYKHWQKTRRQGRREIKTLEEILRIAAENNISKYILVSTADLYAGFQDALSVEEDHQPKNELLSLYLSTLVSAEGKAFDISSSIPAIVIRPAEIYPNTEMPGTSFFACIGRHGPIPLIGPRGALMEFTSVENVTRSVIGAIDCDRGNAFEVFHVSDGNPLYAEFVLREITTIGQDDIITLSRPRARLLSATFKNRGAQSPLPAEPSTDRKRKRPLINGFLLATLGYHLTLDLSRARRILGYEASREAPHSSAQRAPTPEPQTHRTIVLNKPLQTLTTSDSA